MPKPTPTRRRTASPAAPLARKQTFEVVDPRWLLKALGICFAAALLCGYATLCLLFYQGELATHPASQPHHRPHPRCRGTAPSPTSTSTQPKPASHASPAGGSPLPSAQSRSAFTILYLHDGSGSLSDTVPALALLHQTGLNVFAIDYRGFGASDSSVPSLRRTHGPGRSAALDLPHRDPPLPARTIVPYGAGLGASLAVSLALSHPDLPAVILDNPNPDPAAAAIAALPPILFQSVCSSAISSPSRSLCRHSRLPSCSSTADQSQPAYHGANRIPLRPRRKSAHDRHAAFWLIG